MNHENVQTRFATTAETFSDEFQRLTQPYLHELLVHCYRFLGSSDDAEDALQETLLRAWRKLDTLKERSAVRAWLYKIATHVSLDLIDQRKTRGMPVQFTAPADPGQPLPAAVNDPIWLSPLSDTYLDFKNPNPETRVELRESVSLAFLTALQQLPARQRAALILRDVLDWNAQETAELLNLTTAAANSALQRARATLEKFRQTQHRAAQTKGADPQWRVTLKRYQQAWENADVEGLVALLRDDAIYSMPPLPVWYQGRAAIREFLNGNLFGGQATGRYRLLETRANASPAFGVYQIAPDGVYRPAGLQVLRFDQDLIAQTDTFLTSDPAFFARFGLPDTLPA